MKIALSTLLIIALAGLPVHAHNTENPTDRAQHEERNRTGAGVLWQRNDAAREEALAIVRKFLAKPLTVSSAVQIALLNNRGLQATFEEIGIAQSDVIEAVTIPNPTAEFDVQFPVSNAPVNRYGWVVAQDFAKVLMIPLKKRMAIEALEAAELRVAAQVLNLVANVKKAYFEVQAGQQLVARLKIVQETNAASLELSQKQFKAGNITDLGLLQMQSSYSEGRLEIAEAETDLEERIENLNELLGLWGLQTVWEIRGDLPAAGGDTFSMQNLESLAVGQRLDLRAAQRDLTSLASNLGLAKAFRFLPVFEAGLAGEKDIDSALNMGPQFNIELPIFNQGQSRIARGQALLRQAADKYEALAVSIRSDARKFRRKLMRLRDRAAFYHDDVLPTRIKIVNRGILQYNAMQLSPFELFQAKAAELTAERGYIETLRDYWITRAELERTVGGTLTLHKQVFITTTKQENHE